MKDIYQIIEETYPGVVLESPVQGWLYLEAFDEGIAAYERIIPTHATPQDDRWLGICYFQKFEDLKAVELFYRAIARGEERARINLANAFLFIERSSEVLPELAKLDFDKLDPYSQVVYLRVRSIYEEYNGDLQVALQYAERAWRLVQPLPELPILAPQILNQIGVLYGRIGRAQRALWYIERCLELSQGLERKRGLARHAYLLILLGRYEDALAELRALREENLPNIVGPVILYQGEATWSLRDIPGATQYFEEAIGLALDKQMAFEELQARLALAAIYGHQGLIATASEHLARAKVLISDKTDRLMYAFRDALLSRWTGEASLEETCAELARLATEFGEMSLFQERGWVKLHLAEIYRQLGDERYLKELDELQSLGASLQNTAFLAREWTLVPKLRELALKSHPKLAGKSTEVLEVYTMGEERLVLNGKVVNIRLRKGVEVLAYFLEHQQVSLKKLLLEVFADEEPKTARNYFHQFKHELHERIPGLTLEYDPEARLYTLKSEINILWDVAELRAGRKMGEVGLFLPGSGSEWALMLEHELEPLREEADRVPVPPLPAS